jgi:hypothetical protein
MLSPWRTIFNNVENHTPVMVADYNYCNQKGIDYNPVVSPGASTMHLRDGAHMRNWKPRNGGHFLWSQVYEVVKMGSKFMYVAMFDEVDEGTAMYKLVETVDGLPVGAHQVPLDEDGYDLPSDWYLQIGTEIQKMLEGTLDLTPDLPNAIEKSGTSIREHESGWEIYPVPAQHTLFIKGAYPGSSYKVFDRLGILQLGGMLQDQKIDISSLPEGIYILQVDRADNVGSLNHLFIKN